MEYKGYKIESIKNDGHLKRNAFGIYKNDKLISTATTSEEAQHEIDELYKKITVTYDLIDKGDNITHKIEEIPYSKKNTHFNELKSKYPKSKGWVIANYTVHDSYSKINEALCKLIRGEANAL